MSITVKPHHPLQELIAKCLHGIEGVPRDEQRRMVNRVAREAVKWHEAQMANRPGVKEEASDVPVDSSCNPGAE